MSGDGAAIGSQLDDIEVETAAKATRAIETLNKALEEVSTAQAKLGAIQNRLPITLITFLRDRC